MNIRFPVLSALSLGSVEYFSLLNSLRVPPHLCADLLEQMEQEGLISGSFSRGAHLSLTPAGSALYLQLLEDQRAAEAERLKQLVKEQTAESIRLAERAENIARDERRHKEQKMVTLKAAVFACMLTGVVSVVSGLALAYALHLFGL